MTIKNLIDKKPKPNPPELINNNDGKYDWLRIYVYEYYNVRSAPSINADILRVLPIGIYVEVENSNKPWLKIKDPRYPNQIGYVSATILQNQPFNKELKNESE